MRRGPLTGYGVIRILIVGERRITLRQSGLSLRRRNNPAKFRSRRKP